METSLWVVLGTIVLMDVASLITPGQDFVMVTRNTIAGGKQMGVATSVGIASAALLHCLLMVVGLSRLLVAWPGFLAFMKTVGALYLLYVGAILWKSSFGMSQKIEAHCKKEQGSVVEIPDQVRDDEKEYDYSIVRFSWKQAWKMGFVSNITNVEVMLFVASVFTVVVPAGMMTWEFVGLICLVIFCDNLVWGVGVTYIFSNQRLRAWFVAKKQWLDRIAGGVLVWMGSKLLIGEES